MSKDNRVRIIIDEYHWLKLKFGYEIELNAAGVVLVPSQAMMRAAELVKTRMLVQPPKVQGEP